MNNEQHSNRTPSFSRKRLLSISRPRFWIYVLGPFLIGMIAAGDPRLWTASTALLMLLLFVFFTFPSNLLIYGVNDIFDYETDKLNPKKQDYEGLIVPHEQKKLWKIIALWNIPFLFLVLLLPGMAWIAFLVFVFTSLFYSATPIRAKAKPPLDIIFSSTIYISPAVIAFFATGNQDISWLAILGGFLWASAMQTYSAVPDIKADTDGGVATLATVLGQKAALWFCFLAYAAAAYIGFLHIGVIALILGAFYLVLVAMTLRKPNKSFEIYKKFPIVNTVLGMILFFILVARFVL